MYPRVSLYAFMLAAAGIPLYIHLPRFASVTLGMDLAVLGSVLLAIRLIDLAQDPGFGWMIDRWPRAQLGFALIAAAGLAIGFPLLFTASGPGQSTLRLGLVLVLLFSAYSMGTVLLYGRSATLAERPDEQALTRLAAWRETGMLGGVILAAIAPTLLVALGAAGDGYRAYGWVLGAIALIAALLSAPIWRKTPIPGQRLSLAALGASGGTRLLILALVNALPVAITSTLFLFFVEDRLQLPNLAGPFLVLFFAAAALTVPLWTRLSSRIGARRTLLWSMPLAVAAFVGAALLPAKAIVGFTLICLASGAALGADMALLPAMFSIVLARDGIDAGAAFGLWSFAGKLGLALAAFAVLPVLQWAGYTPAADNSPGALTALTLAYALLPCLLKLVAIGLVLTLPKPEPAK